MNKIILSHTSALYFIRKLRTEHNVKNSLVFAEEIIRSRKKQGCQRLEILVNSQNKKHNNWRFNYHVYSNSLPHNSITKLTDEISVVCPELLLIQLSKIMPFETLCIIFLEFCGTYSISPAPDNFVSNISPITNVDKVKEYVNKFSRNNNKAWGLASLRRAFSIAANNSASPMESRLYVKLCGPKNMGMYGCKDLKFNCKIDISSEAKKIAGQNFIVPDISNKDKKVAIEYNSTQFHENIIQGQKDQRRRDALVHDGWKVFSFTPEQVYDRQTFNIIARKILHALGQSERIRIKNFSELNLRAFDLLK